VVINEIYYNPPEGPQYEFIELFNGSSLEIDLSLWQFTNGIQYTIPEETRIPAGGYLVVAKNPEFFRELFSPDILLVGGFDSNLDNGGERLELSDASGMVIDSVRYDDRFPWDPGADGDGGSLERVCAEATSQAARNWTADPTRGPTPGRPNHASACPLPAYVAPPVVINELFYHALNDRDQEEEFIELKNTTGETVDLTGWAISDGVTFPFPPGTTLPPHETLVVASDPDFIRSQYGSPRVLGGWNGTLSNEGERVALSDEQGRDVDALVYLDKGEWPAAADGTGRSLEKMLPQADGSDPASWSSASCSGFQFIETTGVATSSRIYIYFEGEGEGLMDDLSLTPLTDPDGERLPGGDFNEAPTGWSFKGNHADSRWQPTGGVGDSGCLRIVSNGAGGSSSNSVYRYTDPSLTNGATYRLRFKLMILSGASSLVVRLSGSSDTQGVFVRPTCKTATPGFENVSLRERIPPFVAHVRHSPGEPYSDEAVTISAHVRGEEVSSVRLQYTTGTASDELLMLDDGLSGDALPGDGIYGVQLPPFPHNTLVRFQIYASGGGETARYPPEGDPAVDLGYYVNDDQPGSPLPVYHILIDRLNNLGCSVYSTGTFVAGGKVFLNVGVRNRGQTACGQTKNNIKVRFNRGHYFLGKRKINLNGLWSDKSQVREKLQWDLWRDQNQPHCQSWHARVHNNGEYFGLYVYIENPDRFHLERNGLNQNGNLYKAVSSTEQKQSSISAYKSAYEKKTNEDGDFTDLANFIDQLNDTPDSTILPWLLKYVEVEAMLDYEVVTVAAGNVDHGHKNHYLYHDTSADRWWPLIWDLDLSYGRTYVASNHGVYNDEIRPTTVGELYGVGWNRLLTRFFNARSSLTPGGTGYFRRAYYGRLWAVLREKVNEQVTGDEVEFLRDLLQEEQALDFDRWGRYPSRPAPGDPPHPPDFNYNLDELLEIGAAAGRGFLRRHLSLLRGRLNTLGFQGFPWVRISEIMYNPPGSSEDLEFLEIYNTENNSVNVSGWYVDTIDYQIPQGTFLQKEEAIILSKNPEAFQDRYPNVTARVFGPYPGNLGNDGDSIRLLEAKPSEGPDYPAYHPITIDFVRYGDGSPWPDLADDGGYSLEIADIALDNDYASSWMASRFPGGSPGTLEIISDEFRRGDADISGEVDLTDVMVILGYLFLAFPSPGCQDAMDTNDTGDLDIADAIFLVHYLFGSASPPPLPGPQLCGPDPTQDLLPPCMAGCGVPR